MKREKWKIIENKFDLKREKSRFQISKGNKPQTGKVKTMTMTWEELKSIDVEAAEHYDGMNSYFAGIITLESKSGDVETISMPFQYGYGSQWEYEAGLQVQKRFPRTNFAKEGCPLWGVKDRYKKELYKNKTDGKSQRYLENLVK